MHLGHVLVFPLGILTTPVPLHFPQRIYSETAMNLSLSSYNDLLASAIQHAFTVTGGSRLRAVRLADCAARRHA